MPPTDALDRIRASLGTTLVATDFDGTLSPIVDDPAAAAPADGAIEVLVELSDRVGELAVVSGRPLEYLDRHLPADLTLVGLYGLATRRAGTRVDHPEGRRWAPVVADAAEHARREGPDGMVVEPKDLSLTLHYRQHPELGAAVAELADRLAVSGGLVVRPARMSVELHPPIAEDKGTALERLAARHTGPVVFLGDDVGDLAAFDALDRLSAAGRPVVRVVAVSPETDPRLRERADVTVDGPAGVVELLRGLLVP